MKSDEKRQVRDYGYWKSISATVKHNKGKGWVEIREGVFDYVFSCKDCGGILPKGFVVAPNFCPYCGKEQV